jgi:hypothetical protein
MGSFILLEKEAKQILFRFILLGSEKHSLKKSTRLTDEPWLWPGFLFDEF